MESIVIPRFPPISIESNVEDIDSLLPRYVAPVLPHQTHEWYGNLHCVAVDPVERAMLRAGVTQPPEHEVVEEVTDSTPEIDLKSVISKAIASGSVQELEMALQHTSINSTNVLSQAAGAGQLSLVEYLIENGALVDKMDQDATTPLLLASMNGHLDVVKFLVQKQANLNHLDSEGFNALHLAASKGHLHVVKELLERGLSVNQQTSNGSTALMLAAAQGHLDCVNFLLESNADPLILSTSLDTAYDFATQSESFQIAELLEEAEKHAVTKLARETQQAPQNLFPTHQTRVVSVYEYQKSTLLSPRSFSTSNLGRGDKAWSFNKKPITGKFAVELPPPVRDRSGNMKRTWYWLTEWTLDQKTKDGWEYSKNGEEWLPELPRNVGGLVGVVVGGSGWFRRRRWSRVMKRRSDLDPGFTTIVSDSILDLNDYMARAKRLDPNDREGILQILLSGLQTDTDSVRKAKAGQWANQLLGEAEEELQEEEEVKEAPRIVKEKPVMKWQLDEESPNCNGKCKRPFSFTLRKHHCRMCGLIYCNDCSNHRLNLGQGVATVRVCDNCVQGQVKRSSSQRSLAESIMQECPGCGLSLNKSQEENEAHVAECLTKGATRVGDRYIVRTLTENPHRECEICYEELLPGQQVAVLNCLDIFHEQCASSWFARGKTCPIHHPE